MESKLQAFLISIFAGGDYQLHALASLAQRNSLWYILDRKLNGSQNWS
jgi:hypothetical protein